MIIMKHHYSTYDKCYKWREMRQCNFPIGLLITEKNGEGVIEKVNEAEYFRVYS